MKTSFITNFLIIILMIFIIFTLIIGICHLKLSIIIELFKDYDFLIVVFFSIKTAFFATILSVIFGVPIGLFLSRTKSKIAKTIIDIIVYVPIVLPPLVTGILILTALNTSFIKNIYQFVFTASGAVIAQFFVAFPLLIIISKNSFDVIPKIYEMVAHTLGKSKYKAFIDTTFTISLSNIFSGIILTWLRCIGEFGATLIIGGGIPGVTENIPINIYFNILNGDINKGITVSFISIFLAIICIIIVKYFSNKKYIQ